MKRLYAAQARHIRSLYTAKGRKEHGLFAAEGIKSVRELLSSGRTTEFLVFDENFDTDGFMISCPEAKKKEQYTGDITGISTFGHSEGIIAVGRIPDRPEEQGFFSSGRKLLGLFGISDPGNLGTLIRTACWFGLDGVVLYDNCADIYSPKVIRSSMGAVFHTDIIEFAGFDQSRSLLSEHEKIGTFLDIENNYVISSGSKKILFLGNEANGLDEKLKEVADHNYRIGSCSKFDSLNVSVAGGIVMNEIFNKTGAEKC